MYLLCDTSSVLMLLPIAREMLCDEKYECKIVPDVKNEILKTTKFKNKYPWRTEMRNKIKDTGMLAQTNEEFITINKFVENILSEGAINEETGKFFDLSKIDKTIAAFAKHSECDISTCDKNLAAFAQQHFDIFNFYPLEILNDWIKRKLVPVDDNLMAGLKDWAINHEPGQPKEAIAKFEVITGRKYPGP